VAEGRAVGAARVPGHAAALWSMGGCRRSIGPRSTGGDLPSDGWVARPSKAPGPRAAPTPLRMNRTPEKKEDGETSNLAARDSRPTLGGEGGRGRRRGGGRAGAAWSPRPHRLVAPCALAGKCCAGAARRLGAAGPFSRGASTMALAGVGTMAADLGAACVAALFAPLHRTARRGKASPTTLTSSRAPSLPHPPPAIESRAARGRRAER
jgi:hypothetical protein